MKENKSFARTLAFINGAALAAVILINALANALPINGITTGEISDLYVNLFVPAGITFSIWGLIYLLLIVWVIFQFRASKTPQYASVLKSGPWFLVSSVGNILWILFWHYLMVWLSLAAMLVVLFSLIKLYLSIDVGSTDTTMQEKLMYHLPISVYLGWISVATIANVTAVLVSIQWRGFGIPESVWTVIVIAAGVVVAVGMIIRRRDLVHPLVVIWAYIGIVIKRSADAEPVTSVIAAVWIAVALIIAAVAVSALKGRNYLAYAKK